jgi:hypothetical protein
MVHTCNPSTQDAKAGGSQLQSQAGLHSKILSLKMGGKKDEKREEGRKEVGEGGREEGKEDTERSQTCCLQTLVFLNVPSLAAK